MQTAPFPRRRILQLAGLSALAVAAAGVSVPSRAADAPADAFAGKTIKIIVPFTAGGSSDIIARAISTPLAEALKATVVVDNKVGANGNIGADFVAKSAPNGLTLLMCDVRALAISPSLYTQLPFDPSKNLQPVAMLAYSPHLLVVHPSVPANTLPELVELSKKKPLSFAVTALASAPHLAGIQLQEKTGAKWEYIPYKGGSQAINDTIAGQAEVLMNGMLATLPFVQSKRLKIIAVSSPKPMAQLPGVPTIGDTVKGFESGTWQGVMAPAGLPAAQLERLSAELLRIIHLPAVREQLIAQGADISTMPPAEMSRFFETERKGWAAVVAKAGLKLD